MSTDEAFALALAEFAERLSGLNTKLDKLEQMLDGLRKFVFATAPRKPKGKA